MPSFYQVPPSDKALLPLSSSRLSNTHRGSRIPRSSSRERSYQHFRGSYYALEQKHLASAKVKSGSQKTRIRALIAILDNFPFEVSPSIEQEMDKEDSEKEMTAWAV